MCVCVRVRVSVCVSVCVYNSDDGALPGLGVGISTMFANSVWDNWPQFTQHGHTLDHDFPPPLPPSPTLRSNCRTIQHG